MMVFFLYCPRCRWHGVRAAFKGIKARGNFIVDIDWKDGKLATARLFSTIGGICNIRTTIPCKVIEIPGQQHVESNNWYMSAHDADIPFRKDPQAKLAGINDEKGYVLNIITAKGKTYTIVPL
jgi:alpha-L-fucosidase 2